MKRLDAVRTGKNESARGSVSVYFIAATASFVLLSALLIDFSRIAVFRKQAELAIHSGVRSVLSSYDPAFYARYGLFIRGGDDARDLLRTTVEGHFGDKREGRAFPYLQAEWLETGVTESRPLADHEVFLRQVQEEMKYKVPVDLALEFAERFRGVSPALKEAAATVNMLEKMRQAYERREAALDDALDAQSDAEPKLASLLRSVAPIPPVPLSGRLPAGGVRHAADAALRYDDYVAQRLANQTAANADADSSEQEEVRKEVEARAKAVASYESGMVQLAVALAEAAAGVRAAAEAANAAAQTALRQAESENENMKRIAEEAAASRREDEPSGADGPSDDDSMVDSEKVNTLAEIRRTADRLIRDDGFFESYAAELGAQLESGRRLGAEANKLSTLASAAPGSSGMGGALLESAGRLQTAISEYREKYGSGGSVIRERRASLQSQRGQEEERKALEREASSEWSGWQNLRNGLSGRLGSEEEREQFRKADELARDNLTWNEQQPSRPESDLLSSRDPSEARDRAMGSSNSLMNALGEALGKTRNSLFLSEYAVNRLSHFPASEAKRMLEGKEVTLSPDKQEAEFMLYGFSNPTGNIAAAYGELFAVRLAIRTMEGLIENRGVGHPLLLLAAALLYGVRNALQDMRLMLDRGSVPLSKYVKLNTTYEDYLRLFLLTHGHSSGAVSRCIAVMELGTGLRFSRAYTYVSGEATASLRLWFFPGLMRLLGGAGKLGGTVKGDRYEAAYTADIAYQ